MRRVKLLKYIPLVFLLAVFGCENEDQRRIPDFPVYLQLNLSGEYATFTNPLDTVVYPTKKYEGEAVGFGGILANIGYDGKYYAYDLACPYEVDRAVRVFPDGSGMKVICRKCGSEFNIWDGTGMVSKGPSKWNLKRYAADLYNGVLHISRR